MSRDCTTRLPEVTSDIIFSVVLWFCSMIPFDQVPDFVLPPYPKLWLKSGITDEVRSWEAWASKEGGTKKRNSYTTTNHLEITTLGYLESVQAGSWNFNTAENGNPVKSSAEVCHTTASLPQCWAVYVNSFCTLARVEERHTLSSFFIRNIWHLAETISF